MDPLTEIELVWAKIDAYVLPMDAVDLSHARKALYQLYGEPFGKGRRARQLWYGFRQATTSN